MGFNMRRTPWLIYQRWVVSFLDEKSNVVFCSSNQRREQLPVYSAPRQLIGLLLLNVADVITKGAVYIKLLSSFLSIH